MLLPDDPRFPQTLRDIPEPPALLYAWGNVDLFARPAAGVVGSRNHSAYGATAARILAEGVAQAGVVIVSGMARGIDAIAHAAALDAGGASLGVLGNGFGVVYPAANRPLYERMIAHGCLVTELPPGERPHAHTFPRRNRLISGLAGVTVVVEAAAGPRAAPLDLGPLQRKLWDALGAEPQHVDALVAAAGAETSAVLTALTELEMRGLVKQQPGMRFGIS